MDRLGKTSAGLPEGRAPCVPPRRRNPFRVLVLLGLTVWSTGTVSAQTVRELRFDTSEVELRRPAAGTLEAYRSDPAFVYDRRAGSADDLWTRLRNWLLDRIIEPLEGHPVGRLIRWLLYAIAAGGLVFAVLRLLRMEAGAILSVRDRRGLVGAGDDVESIEGIDFEAAITAAVAAGSYRDAVRLQYLRVLRVLSDRGLIEWQRDKTNRSYVDEIGESGLRPLFAYLTSIFEYVWYGEFAVDAGRYGQMQGAFDRFRGRIDEEGEG